MFSRPFIMENEIWKFIPDYPSYSISSLGRIKCNHGSYENLIQPWLTKGYCYITLINQYGKKKYQVHRLVGELFIPNPENKPQINHKFGIKTDNRVSELEWSTSSENHLHAYKTLNRIPGMLGKIGKLNKKSKPVFQMDLQNNVIEKWDSMGEAGKKYGHHSKIVMCCLGTRKTAYGYKWKLV